MKSFHFFSEKFQFKKLCCAYWEVLAQTITYFIPRPLQHSLTISFLLTLSLFLTNTLSHTLPRTSSRSHQLTRTQAGGQTHIIYLWKSVCSNIDSHKVTSGVREGGPLKATKSWVGCWVRLTHRVSVCVRLHAWLCVCVWPWVCEASTLARVCVCEFKLRESKDEAIFWVITIGVFFWGVEIFFPFSFYSKEAAALYFFPAAEEIKLSKSWANAANKNLAVKYGLDHHKDEKLQMEPVGQKKGRRSEWKKGKKCLCIFIWVSKGEVKLGIVAQGRPGLFQKYGFICNCSCHELKWRKNHAKIIQLNISPHSAKTTWARTGPRSATWCLK